MPEELNGAFSDLPEAPVGSGSVEASAEEQPEQSETAKLAIETGKLLAEKEKMAQEERSRRKEETKRRKELEAEIAELKKPKEDEEEPAPPPKEDIRSAIREENYRNESVKSIRNIPGITRPMAEELQKLVDALPKSGDADMDVRAAMAYYTTLKGQAPGPVMNAGFGSSYGKPKESVPESAIRLGQEVYGLNEEDFKKHSGTRKI